MNKVSDKGLVALAIKEGLVPAPYLDSVGVWTYGIGLAETSGLEPNPVKMKRGMPDNIDEAINEALRIFPRVLKKYEDDVNRAVKVPVAQHEFDALVSFHYNTGGISRAALTRHLNAGKREAAAKGFMGWTKPPEIRKRREAEMRLFRDGVYPDGEIPVYNVTASNRPGKVIKSLTGAEALAIIKAGDAKPQQTTPTPRPSLMGIFAAVLRLLQSKVKK